MNKILIIIILLLFVFYLKNKNSELFQSGITFPECLTVYNYHNKIRLGNNSDGGYVITDIGDKYDCYISCGVSNEESFSRDFIKKYNMNKLNSFAFDGTIEDYPYEFTKDITFIKKNISDINDDVSTNLDFLLEKYNNIFLKMDIEGWEFQWLLHLTSEKLKKFKQIVIEVHGVNDDTWNFTQKDKIKCFNKLNEQLYLIHVHGNNCAGIINKIPDVLELTLYHTYDNTIPHRYDIINYIGFPKIYKYNMTYEYDFDCYPWFNDHIKYIKLKLTKKLIDKFTTKQNYEMPTNICVN